MGYSPRGHRVGQDWLNNTHTHTHVHTHTHSRNGLPLFFFAWDIIIWEGIKPVSEFSPAVAAVAAVAKLVQSCPTLCDPIDGSPPGFPIPGILQARTLEWVTISFSNAWKWKVKMKPLSHVWLLATPWTAAYQAPPSMGLSRQEYWSGVPLPSSHWLASSYSPL